MSKRKESEKSDISIPNCASLNIDIAHQIEIVEDSFKIIFIPVKSVINEIINEKRITFAIMKSFFDSVCSDEWS